MVCAMELVGLFIIMVTTIPAIGRIINLSVTELTKANSKELNILVDGSTEVNMVLEEKLTKMDLTMRANSSEDKKMEKARLCFQMVLCIKDSLETTKS